MSFGAYMLASASVLAGLAALIFTSFRLADRLVPSWSGAALWIAGSVIVVAAAVLGALLLGTFGLLTGWIYLLLLLLIASAAWRWAERIPLPDGDSSREVVPADGTAGESAPRRSGARTPLLLGVVGIAIASVAVGLFAVEVWQKFGTGMTGFDSTWYHGPFAAGFASSGDTHSLHFVAPQFLSWFYPQNSELVHSLGILGFGNDLLSPLVNFGWLAGCLLAAWAIGRPYGAAPVSLAGVALVLGSAAMADQAGEARNDMAGAFFVLASLAILVNGSSGGRRPAAGPVLLAALSAGLAAGTKINFIPAAIALAVGAAWLSGPGRRSRSAIFAAGGLVLGGAYWYLRNLIQSGNPLPWVDGAGPLSLPSPDQELGGRDAASVVSYLGDPGVITDWFLPGLADGFGEGWPLLLGLAVLAVALCLWKGSDPVRRVGAIVALTLLLAWIAAPTSASGPTGEPAGFVSGLRYLAPALAVGLALLGSAVGPRGGLARGLAMATLVLLTPFVVFGGRSWDAAELVAAALAAAVTFVTLVALTRTGSSGRTEQGRAATGGSARTGAAGAGHGWSRTRTILAAAVLAAVVLAGYAAQERYFDNRYASPEFTTAGLSEAFVWARGIEDASIATNATRQYPLFGSMLDNEVDYLGVPGSNGGFVKVDSCEQFRDAVARGDYDYLVLTLDRENPDRPFPREIPWIEEDPNAVEVLKTPPTAVYELEGPLDPATCP